MTVQLSVTPGYSSVPLLNTGQLAYLLVEAVSEADARNVPVNFCFVLDRSPSMFNNGRVKPMQRAVRRLIRDLLGPDDICGIVLFDEGSRVLAPCAPVSHPDHLMDLVDDIDEGNDTKIAKGLRAGRDQLVRNHGPNVVSRLILLTDGQTSQDEDECRRLAAECGSLGIPIIALGLGEDWNETLLDDLAERSGGGSDYIAQPEDILGHFSRTVQQAKGLQAKSSQLDLVLPVGVSPRAAYLVSPLISPLGYPALQGDTVTVELGELTTDQPSVAMFEILLPALPVGMVRIAMVRLRYQPLAGGHEVTVERPVIIEVVASDAIRTADPRVMNIAEKVTAFKLRTRALSAAEANDLAGAAKTMKLSADAYARAGDEAAAAAVGAHAQELERGAVSAATQKLTRYATQRLKWPPES